MDLEKSSGFIYEKLALELPPTLFYHSIDHVKDVYDSCLRIAVSEGIQGDDLVLLKTAALYHDSGFTVQGKDHESIGCEISRRYLPQFGYDKIQIDSICGMIMATKIPQSPFNLLEEIICDADLDYLGRDDYWTISNYLIREIRESADLSELAWLKIQIDFFEQHRYFTQTAVHERAEKKQYYLEILKENLKNYPSS